MSWHGSGGQGVLLLAVLSILVIFAAANVADLLVIGVDLDPADPRAYPIEILNYHEIVNDVIAGRHVAITWSPLTYSNVLIETESLLSYVLRLLFNFYPFHKFITVIYIFSYTPSLSKNEMGAGKIRFVFPSKIRMYFIDDSLKSGDGVRGPEEGIC